MSEYPDLRLWRPKMPFEAQLQKDREENGMTVQGGCGPKRQRSIHDRQECHVVGAAQRNGSTCSNGTFVQK